MIEDAVPVIKVQQQAGIFTIIFDSKDWVSTGKAKKRQVLCHAKVRLHIKMVYAEWRHFPKLVFDQECVKPHLSNPKMLNLY